MPRPRASLALDPIELQAKLFRGFSDRSRLAILRALLDGPRTVTELVAATGLSQPNASNHLSCLRDCGLVLAQPEGKFTRYRIADPQVERVLTVAHQLLVNVAEKIADCARYED